MTKQIIKSKDSHGEPVWRIVVDGIQHPVSFKSELLAIHWLGLLSGQGFGKRKTEAA